MDSSQMITVDDVRSLVVLARVYGIPAMRLNGGKARGVQAIIDKWDRLNGGRLNPPMVEHGEGKSE